MLLYFYFSVKFYIDKQTLENTNNGQRKKNVNIGDNPLTEIAQTHNRCRKIYYYMIELCLVSNWLKST